MNDDQKELELDDEWKDAEVLARNGDSTKLITMLRKLHQPYEVPDLWFLADLIEGNFNRTKGRPSRKKIRSGVDQRLAAEIVAHIIHEKKVTIEVAVEEAAKVLAMSESAIKKHYIALKDQKLLENSLFKNFIGKTFK